MVRLFVFLTAAALVLLVLALIGALSADRVRTMPRPLWVLIIVLVPLLGPSAYFLVGRPAPAGVRRVSRARPAAPDDDLEFLRRLGSRRRAADREAFERWERQLHGHDEEPPGDPPRPETRNPDNKDVPPTEV